MDRSDEFIYLCKKLDKNVNIKKIEKKEKDPFLIKSSEIYTKLFSNCEYIDNNTLKKYGLFLKNKYVKKTKTKIKNKDHLLSSINRISEEINFLKPHIEIHKYILNCLNNLLSIFIDIINKYEQNLSNYHFKLNKYTNFYFYDIQNIKFNFDCLNKLNNDIYSDSYNNQSSKFSPVASFEDSSIVVNKKYSSRDNNKSIHIENENNIDNEKTNINNENDLNNNESTLLNESYYNNNNNINIRKRERNKINMARKENNEMYGTYIYLEEEEEKKKKDWLHDNNTVHDDYLLNNNQKLEFKKYVELFEKEENTYIIETKKKITKINNLMNVFVNKIYEQNENLKMIENIIEESIENVSQGNVYLNKIQNKKNLNSLIFFVLICASLFLFIFDFFR